ncbi:MAG: tetratricopeptide repeat protein [Elusimicrobiota bacterium]
MNPARWRAVLTCALVIVAGSRMARTINEAGTSFDRRYYCSEGKDRNVEAGHALIHGLPHDRITWSMPAGSVANALMCRQTRPGAILAAPTAAFLLDGLLVFGLGGLLAGGTAGALALALFSWTTVSAHAYNERWLFTLSLLLVAFLAVWRARFPSTRKTALLAAAIGFSLNVLSVLVLLPPVLAAWDWRAHHGRPRRERRVNAALLLIVPYLFLLPWTLTNWRMTHKLTLLENGRSDTNVITGAQGLVKTVGPGSSRELAGIPFGNSVLAWAAGEVARHPLRFLDAVSRRLRFVASIQPFLLTAALLALWLFRRRPGQTQLGAVVLYFLLLHCLMPVFEEYFVPLWPLTATLAASLIGFRREEPGRLPWAGRLTACAFLPFAGLAAYAQCLVLAHPSRSADPAAWERELAREPDQSWLLGAAGKRFLRAGRPAEAAAVLTRSLKIAPQREQEQLLSWVAIILQRPDSGLSESLARDPDLGVRQLIMQAMAHLREGRTEAAAAKMSRAEALQSNLSASWGTSAPAATSDSLKSAVRELLQYWPRQDRLAILAGIDKMWGSGTSTGPNDPVKAPMRTARDEAREALNQVEKLWAGRLTASERAEALRLLDYAEQLSSLDAGAVRRVAEEYVRLQAPDRAVDTLRRLAVRRPRDLDLRFDLALLAHAAGRPEAALLALAEARKLCSGAEALRRLAGAYHEIGEPRQAARLLWPLTADRTNASAPDDQAALARLYTEMREYDKALRLLDKLVRLNPKDAAWRNDRGVVLLLLGRKEQVIAELRLALDRDPGLMSAALSLGTLLSSTGRGREAREIYDRALARGGSDARATREKIIAERSLLSD